jgi:hypothetical protein
MLVLATLPLSRAIGRRPESEPTAPADALQIASADITGEIPVAPTQPSGR